MENMSIVSLKQANIFQGNTLVLNNVNLEVEKGEFIYMIGKTGTGKSSLLKTLYGELYLKEGEGNVAGFDLKELSWQKIPLLRRNLGIVFQDFQLMTDRNVMENLLFVLRATGWKEKNLMEERCKEVLQLVNLSTKNFKMPHELSGGEQQRVVIARALLNKPDLILADEPTGNLDPATSIGIMKLLDRINREGTTVLMATHDSGIVDQMRKRVIELDHGHVVRDQVRGVYGYTG